MLNKFLLPDVGEGLTEAEIITWHVSPGDEVQVNDILVEIETAKSIVELPSPYAGTVTEVLAEPGDEVSVGTVIVLIDDEMESDSAEEPEPPTLVGYGASEGKSRRRRRVRDADASTTREAMATAYGQFEPGHSIEDVRPTEPVVAEPVGDPLPEAGQAPTESALVLVTDEQARAKPPVRKYARDLGVDLRLVVGTGPEGTITRRDVEAAYAFQLSQQTQRIGDDDGGTPPGFVAEANFDGFTEKDEFVGSSGFSAGGSSAGPGFGDDAGFAPGARFDPFQGQATRRVPIRGVRKLTAENVSRSVRNHVHVTEWTTIDVSATMELVERLKLRREFAGLRVSPLLVYAKAVALALGRNPDLNSSWDEENQEIVFYRDVNLGIAAATPRGLMVPNIKAANRLSLFELCCAINNLVQVAKDGRLQPSDYSSGTFTITNVGVFGVDAGTPIINGDESAILCMGAIQRRPWVVSEGGEERIEPRWVTTLALSFDHRNVDGEQGSKFLADVAEVLSDPTAALLF